MNSMVRLLGLTLLGALVACAETTSTSQTSTTPEAQSLAAVQATAPVYKVLNDSVASPRKEMTVVLDSVQVVVTYGSPATKGRTIWGDLVPYGEVWRTGANEATTISFSAPVLIGDQPLAAGTYALFTIPGEMDWTLIFNTVTDQWGSYDYDEKKDVMRTKVIPRATPAAAEHLEFSAEADNTIVLTWDKLAIPFVVKAG
ncbi:MAG: DUF2911 domain-containing protein [Bacteroidia bacterium]|nr:DUF2911 domain-containing protein [Bacteroidia bacterium]